MVKAAAALLAVLGLIPQTSVAPTYTNPACWDEPRIYQPQGESGAVFENAAQRSLKLDHISGSLERPHTPSPNRAYAFHQSPETGLHASLVVFKEKDYLLRIRADDARGLRDVRWINERLIFFRLWLGRIGGVDAIVDVETEVIVHMEAFETGDIAWQQSRDWCKARPTDADCTERCVNLK